MVGLLNVQYAVHEGQLYVIEANPRASRTVPFVSKAVGVPLAKLACRIMLGERIADLGLPREREGLGFGEHVSVKEAVLPFDRLAGADAVLGPEMRSTGEVMGIARDFPSAFAKAQAAAGVPLPAEGTAFISVTDSDKQGAAGIAQTLHDNGFRILATRGTAEAIARMGVPVHAPQQDRRRLAARRRLDRARRGGAGDQHPQRLRRPRRRPRDPPGGRRQGHPVPDHAARRSLRRARDRARQAARRRSARRERRASRWSRCRSSTAPRTRGRAGCRRIARGRCREPPTALAR